ncbi:MAG: transcription elongation factor [Myxococcaceae bacterium]|nr:transcription elongation factor [Myxococcaceae bacterium]
MPEKQTVERAKKDLRQGKAPGTAAGEFVREEIKHVRRGQHGAKSPKQAIAIGLSKARRAGVPLGPPKEGRASSGTRKQAMRDLKRGQERRKTRASPKRRQASRGVLKRQPGSTASKRAPSKQAKSAARRRRK